MKLPSILTPQRWPSMTPLKLVLDLPEALIVAHKHVINAHREEPIDPMMRFNLLRPRSSFIANNIYLSTYWRMRALHSGLTRERIKNSVRRALDPAHLKQSAHSILTQESLQKSLCRETDLAITGLVASALRYSNRDGMVRINLLKPPSALYPHMAYLFTRLHFAADLTFETMTASL